MLLFKKSPHSLFLPYSFLCLIEKLTNNIMLTSNQLKVNKPKNLATHIFIE